MLPDAPELAFFLASSLALLLLPGPAVFYVIARSVAQGRDAGPVSALGVGAGSLVHVSAAAFGISALVASSAELFTLLRIAGAAYLVYLGIRALMSTPDGTGGRIPRLAERSLGEVFREGVVVNILNPKTAIFFVAFLPQFADPARGPVGLQIFLLGGMFIVLGIVTDGLYAIASHRITRRFTAGARAQKIRARVAAAVYFVLGAATLTVEAPRT
ncbi:MAG: LysE family translocator [Gammaproteobacteria bacterium]|nr:LysE family translocator [Gammaproteobacteria bacterium]